VLDFLPPSLQGFGLFVIEGALVLLAICLALNAPTLGNRFFAACERAFSNLARRPVLSLVVIGIAPLAIRGMLGQIWPLPTPFVNDEFSYLLGGDTFAHGRLTNPMHPLWVFFESIHILAHPTYATMYQPAQSMFLAIGEVLTGVPWFGVAISTGLMCSALLWMLRGLFSPGWAFLGASIAVFRIGLFSYWMAGYWGGSVSAAAGALVAGAVLRLWKRPRPGQGIRLGAILGVGLVTLAYSRPFEGALFSTPLLIALLWKHHPWKQARWQTLIPLVCILAIGGAWLGYYNWRVTGDPLQLPQALQRQQYAIYGYGAFQTPRPEPVYHHTTLRDFYVTTEGGFKSSATSLWTLIDDFIYRERVLFLFFLGPLLLLPFLIGPKALLSRKLLPLGVAFLCVTAGFVWLSWPINSHYYAPATCAIYAYIVQAMRQVRHAPWKGGPVGLLLIRSIACICILMAVTRSLAGPLEIELAPWTMTWFNSVPGNDDRARIQFELSKLPEKTLIIVRYDPFHQPGDEWVYNEADIDHAKVVWAREMRTGNQRLLDYFHDRRVVLVEPDHDREHWVPYALPSANAR
jgi:hypothetical protein